MPPLQPQSQTASVVDTQRQQLNQVLGKMADENDSQYAAIVTALEAILAALVAQA